MTDLNTILRMISWFFFYLNKKKRLEWIIENGTLYSARVRISPLIETYVIGYINFIYCLCRVIDIMEQLIFKTENLLNDCLMPSSSADTWSELIHRCISESCQVMEYEWMSWSRKLHSQLQFLVRLLWMRSWQGRDLGKWVEFFNWAILFFSLFLKLFSIG